MALVDLGSLNFNNAVEATRAFPVTAVPVGITVLSAAITRGALDPAIVLAWSLELSRDGGTTWLPWGGAGTNGLPAFNKDGTLATESFFAVSLRTPADALTRVRGALTNTGARMTTTITIRGDTTPIQQFAVPPDHHSVVYDNFISVAGGPVTTLTTGSVTIGSLENTVALLGLIHGQQNTDSPITSSVGGVAGALVVGTDQNQTTGPTGARVLFHQVLAPPSGSQTATMTWVTSMFVTFGMMTAAGVSQSGPTANATTRLQIATTAPSITVTTRAGDLTMAIGMTQTVLSAPTQTNLWTDAAVTGGAGSRGPGTGTSDTHGWTCTSADTVCAGCNLVAAPSGLVPAMDLFPKPLMRPGLPWQENMA